MVLSHILPGMILQVAGQEECPFRVRRASARIIRLDYQHVSTPETCTSISLDNIKIRFHRSKTPKEKMNSYRAKTSRKDMLQGIPRPLRCLFLPAARRLKGRCNLLRTNVSHFCAFQILSSTCRNVAR